MDFTSTIKIQSVYHMGHYDTLIFLLLQMGGGHERFPLSYYRYIYYIHYDTLLFPPVFKRAVLKIGFLHRYKHFWYRFDIKYAILG